MSVYSQLSEWLRAAVQGETEAGHRVEGARLALLAVQEKLHVLRREAAGNRNPDQSPQDVQEPTCAKERPAFSAEDTPTTDLADCATPWS